MNLSINKETKIERANGFIPPREVAPSPKFPNGFEFPVCKLLKVSYIPNYDTKNGERQVLSFFFKDSEKREHNHFEWAIEEDDDNFTKKLDGLTSRIGHIYKQTIGDLPEEGFNGNTFEEFFKEIEKAFSKTVIVKDKDVKIHILHPCYYKVTYYSNNLNFPLSINFLERVVEGKACNLTINKNYDKIKQEEFRGLPSLENLGLPTDSNPYS